VARYQFSPRLVAAVLGVKVDDGEPAAPRLDRPIPAGVDKDLVASWCEELREALEPRMVVWPELSGCVFEAVWCLRAFAAWFARKDGETTLDVLECCL
jgi:hypothetical protein